MPIFQKFFRRDKEEYVVNHIKKFATAIRMKILQILEIFFFYSKE